MLTLGCCVLCLSVRKAVADALLNVVFSVATRRAVSKTLGEDC